MNLFNFLYRGLNDKKINKHLFLVDGQDILISFACICFVEFIMRGITHRPSQLVLLGFILVVMLGMLVLYRILVNRVQKNILVKASVIFMLGSHVLESAITHCVTNKKFRTVPFPLNYAIHAFSVCVQSVTPSFCFCQFLSVNTWFVMGYLLCSGIRLTVLIVINIVVFVIYILGGVVLQVPNFWVLHLIRYINYVITLFFAYYVFFCIGLSICRIRQHKLHSLSFLPSTFFSTTEAQSLSQLPATILTKTLSQEEHLYMLLRLTQSTSTRQIVLNLITKQPTETGVTNEKEDTAELFLRTAVLWYHLERYENFNFKRYIKLLPHSCAVLPALYPYRALRNRPLPKDNEPTEHEPRCALEEKKLVSHNPFLNVLNIPGSPNARYGDFNAYREYNDGSRTRSPQKQRKYQLISPIKKGNERHRSYILQRTCSKSSSPCSRIIPCTGFSFFSSPDLRFTSNETKFVPNVTTTIKGTDTHVSAEQASHNRVPKTGASCGSLASSSTNAVPHYSAPNVRVDASSYTAPNTHLRTTSLSVTHSRKSHSVQEPRDLSSMESYKKNCSCSHASHVSLDVLSTSRNTSCAARDISLPLLTRLQGMPLLIGPRSNAYDELLKQVTIVLANPIILNEFSRNFEHRKTPFTTFLSKAMTRVKYLIQGVELVMLKAQWHEDVVIPACYSLGGFIDRKVERWFLAWLSVIQAHHYSTINPVVLLLTISSAVSASASFFVHTKKYVVMDPQGSLPLVIKHCHLYMLIRSLLQIFLMSCILWFQNASRLKGSYNSNSFKLRALAGMLVNFSCCILDMCIQGHYFPTQPTEFHCLVITWATSPLLSQTTIPTTLLVTFIYTVTVYSCIPLLNCHRDLMSSMITVTYICVGLSTYFYYVSRYIILNYRFLFSRYVLSYLLYIDALRPIDDDPGDSECRAASFNNCIKSAPMYSADV